ncbi:MAG: hypothetical protein U0165_12730 [Polyangiaceae bacterium]
MRRIVLGLLLATATGCSTSTATNPAPAVPTTTASSTASAVQPPDVLPMPKNPFVLTEPVKTETPPSIDAPTLSSLSIAWPASAPKGLPPAPGSCKQFIDRKPAAKAPACGTNDEAIAALDAAMSDSDLAKRDALLAALETCSGFAPGFIHSLRVELAPAPCADGFNEALLKKMPANVPGSVQQALMGQAIAAWANRIGIGMPKPPKGANKDAIIKFLKSDVAPWLQAQLALLKSTSDVGLKLSGYAKGIIAVEVGAAAMRVVDEVRSSPIPEEWSKDNELKDAYYGALDQVLTPLKDMGRNASLAGLREYADLGVLHDGRVDRARGLLSKLYGGRRIDALESLIVPELESFSPASASERLLSRLPTFQAAVFFGDSLATDEKAFRARLEQGIAPQVRTKLTDPPAALVKPYALARAKLAQRYWRAVDVDQSAWLASRKAEESPEMKGLLSTMIALRNGPDGAAEMMRRAGQGSTVSTEACDVLAQQQTGAVAAMVKFNAARIRDIAAPVDAKAAYWKDVASRYRAAAAVLSDAKHKAAAEDFAKAADAVADSIK